jgi:hypothetical protein
LAVNYIGKVLRGVRGIVPAQKLILVVLADYARAPGGESWPSVATIAWEAGINRRQVSDHLARLCESGWLQIVGSNRGGRKQTTRYKLNLARIYGDAEQAEYRRTEKHAAGRTVSQRRKHAAGRTVNGAETMHSSVSKPCTPPEKPCTPALETMHSTAYEPLVLQPLVLQPLLSRTPVLKNSDDPTQEQIAARQREKERNRKLLAEAQKRSAK